MIRILAFWTDLFPVWVIAASILAYIKPEIFLPLKSHVSWYFGFTMLGIGSTLNPADLKEVVRTPVSILLGTMRRGGCLESALH